MANLLLLVLELSYACAVMAFSPPVRMPQAYQAYSVEAPSRGSTVEMIRHGKKFNRMGRIAPARKALMRALTTEIIRHGRIRTTLAKAKAVRRHVEKMITLAKQSQALADEDTVRSKKLSEWKKQQAWEYIYDRELVDALFDAAPERYADRQGGYTRIKRENKLRRGDASKMAFIELVE
mmetsp:Transcript_71524/g.113335  ORF Transcript_71524/g.113335 Transcript_71524/m.113335 type:complete len:179 (+) Transcript_71524:47-583(+)